MVVDESYRTCQERNRSLSSVDPCCSVAKSNSLWSHGQQHTRLPSPSLPPGVCSDSWPLGWWCYLTISSSAAPLMLLPSIFPSIRVFSNELALHIRWPKYWSFSFSIRPSSEYSGLISFRIGWLNLLAVQGTLKSLLQHHSLKVSNPWHSAFFIVQLWSHKVSENLLQLKFPGWVSKVTWNHLDLGLSRSQNAESLWRTSRMADINIKS